MAKPTVEELEAAESNLGWAFMLAAFAVVCALGVGLALPRAEMRGGVEWTIFAAAELFLMAAYVWYATAIGRAATYLVPSPWSTSYGSWQRHFWP